MPPIDFIINCKILSPEIVFIRKAAVQETEDTSPHRFCFLVTSNEESCILSLNEID